MMMAFASKHVTAASTSNEVDLRELERLVDKPVSGAQQARLLDQGGLQPWPVE